MKILIKPAVAAACSSNVTAGMHAEAIASYIAIWSRTFIFANSLTGSRIVVTIASHTGWMLMLAVSS